MWVGSGKTNDVILTVDDCSLALSPLRRCTQALARVQCLHCAGGGGSWGLLAGGGRSWGLFAALHIMHSTFIKTNPKEIQSECGGLQEGGIGCRLCRITLNQSVAIQVIWQTWPMAGFTLFSNFRFYCCKCIIVYRLNHFTCNLSWIKLKLYFAKF